MEIILVLYFSILIAIGVVASKKVNNISDYYVGGKKLNYWIAALSARATGESGWLLLGVSGMGAVMGFSAFWIVIGEVLGVFLSWNFMAEKFKTLTDDYKSITVPDFLHSHFKSKTNTIRIIAATALSVFVVIYVSAQIDITGKAFESFLGYNYYFGILIGFGIVVAYIFSGGFLAVAWSDLFQGSMMLLALLVLPIAAYLQLPNGANFLHGLKDIDPALVNIWGDGGFTFMNFLSVIGLLSIGIGFLGSPQVYVRFIAIKNTQEIKKGKTVATIYTLVSSSCAVMIGIIGRFIFTTSSQNPETILGPAGENVLYLLLIEIMPTIVVGIYIAALLSAVMSTVDSLLVVASSAVTRDFYQKIVNPLIDQKTLIKLSKKITLGLALFALFVAVSVSIISPDRTIFWFVIFGWSGIAATFCPVIILSIFWNDFDENGVISSMITGFLCVPVFKFLVPKLENIGVYFEKIDVLLPSVILAMFAGYLATIIKK